MSSGAADRVARWAADRETPNGGVTVTSHTGADFEAGRVHHRNEQIAGAQPSDRRNPDEVRQEQASLRSSSTTQRGIQGFLSDGGGATTVDEGDFQNGRRVRQKKESTSHEITFKGPGMLHNKKIIVFKSDHAAEDERWILILEKKESGTRKYLCVRCGATFHGKPGRVVSHCLRISGEQVATCNKTLPVELSDVLQRLRGSSSSSPTGKASATKTVARTPSAATGLSSQATKTAVVDEALAKLICTYDLSCAPMFKPTHHNQLITTVYLPSPLSTSHRL